MNEHNDEPASVHSKRLVRSFAAAWAGLAHAVRTQRNMRIHLGVVVAVAAAACACRVSRWEACVLALTATLVLVLELLNTSLEAAIDLYSPERHPLARIAKDTAAAAVLVAAGASVIIGMIVFLPHLLALITP
jgi:diacylglycerol kinase